MTKPKIAFYWCASCGGCEEAVIDLGEDLLAVVELVEVAFWPVALDFKRDDVEALDDGELAAAFINGAVRTSEQEEMARLLRRKSAAVIAFGSCAMLGGVPGLANLYESRDILDAVYRQAPSVQNDDGTLPAEESHVAEGELTLPAFSASVRTLDQVIDVDYYLPGCPPPTGLITSAVTALVEGKLPGKGAVLAPDVALCSECPRAATKPDKLLVQAFRRPHQGPIDPELCLFAQGLVCLGPATRAGCAAACPGANMPCTGCMGPTSKVIDYGAKALSAVASVLDADGEDEIAARVAEIADPVGTFYRYCLPASLLHRRVRPAARKDDEEVAPRAVKSLSTPRHGSRGTGGYTSSSIMAAVSTGPTCRSRSCAASRSSSRGGAPRTCRRSPRASAASARWPTTWPRRRPSMTSTRWPRRPPAGRSASSSTAPSWSKTTRCTSSSSAGPISSSARMRRGTSVTSSAS